MSLALLLAAASLLVLGLGTARPQVRRAAEARTLLGVLAVAPVPAALVRAVGGLPIRPGVRDRLGVAGMTRRELAVARAAAAGLCALIALALMVVVVPVGVISLMGVPLTPFMVDLLVVRDAQRHGHAVVRQLPDALDLLSAATGGGMALDPALELVGARLGGAIGREFELVRRALAHGSARPAAYAALRNRVPLPEMDHLVGALTRADELGAPLAETLARQADAMRHARAQRARDAAAKAGPKIQLVIALVMVPATLMLVIGLLLIELTRQVNAVIGAG